jgi:DNA replication protein DnaC
MTDNKREDQPAPVADLFAKSLFDAGPPSHAAKIRADLAVRRAAGIPHAPRLSTSLDVDEVAELNRMHAVAFHVSNTPLHFAGVNTDNPGVRGWADAYLRDPVGTPWLLLLGGTGTGKTHQAYGALRHMAMSGRPPIARRAVNAADLYAALRPSGSDDPEAEFAAYAGCPLLLLDDLGATRRTDFTEEITYRLIDHRYSNCLGAIITSNVEPDKFSKRFGDRVTSRLIEKCRLIDLGLEDRRIAGKAA